MNKAILAAIFLFELGLAAGAEGPFTGYLPWNDVSPFVNLTWEDPRGKPYRVTLLLFCPGAQEVKIANSPDFAGTEWKPMQTEVRWTLGNEDIATVFVVYKKRLPEGKGAMVTPVVSYTLDRKNTWKKIERFGAKGYFDWSTGLINAAAEARDQATDRHGHGNSQALAEETLSAFTYDIAVALPLEPGLSLRELLRLEPRLENTLLGILPNLRITDISHPSSGQTRVEGNLIITGSAKNTGFIGFASPLRHPRIPRIEAQWDVIYQTLVLDVRGFRYSPGLFPQVKSDDGRALVNTSRTTNRFLPYARYLRSLDDKGAMPAGFWPAGVKAPRADKQLFVKAVGLDGQEPGTIIVSRRQER
ncbi:MAG: hypothetical protein JNM63_00115, partial [Spirochaetia bacterium]|nr:hypothetical protein [Spirochaetia bacterium]